MSNAIVIEFRGIVYASRNEAVRQTGVNRKRIKRESVVVPMPPPVRNLVGAEDAAKRIERAAERIREIATAQQIEGVGTAIEIYKRRKGLIKAIIHFRQRYGVGIGEYL